MNLAKEKKIEIGVFFYIIYQQYGTLQILNDRLSSLFKSILANFLGFEFKPSALHFEIFQWVTGKC